MEAYQERVVEEKKELDDKIEKLAAFLQTDTFGNLPDVEQARMTRQKRAMKEYSKALGERIAAV